MKALFRFKTLFFGLLAVSIGATTGVVLAAHTVHRAAPAATAISVNFAGDRGAAETTPEPEATASPEPEAEASPEPETQASPEPEPEATESPEAENQNENESEPSEHPSPTPASTAATSTETFTLVGGTVTLSCPASGPIMLDSATPNAGFSFEQSREDGDSTIEIRFESSSHESRLQADCAAGQVQVLEQREESN
jgi:outer membrane biosynthesis protein TonB